MGTRLDMGKKRQNPLRDRIELRADPKWIDLVTREAERLGLGISAFIRLAVNERLERMAAERAAAGGKK